MNIQKEGNNIIYPPPFAMHASKSVSDTEGVQHEWVGKPVKPHQSARSSRTRLLFFLPSFKKTPRLNTHVYCQRRNKSPIFASGPFCVPPPSGRQHHSRALATDEAETAEAVFAAYEHLSPDKWNVSQAPVHRCVFPREASQDAFR